MKIALSNFIQRLIVAVAGMLLLASCNKDVEDAVPLTRTASTATQTIAGVLNDPNYSIFKAAVARAGLTATLADSTSIFTVFAPTDQAFQMAFQALGIPAAVGINAFRPGQLDTILRYHIVGGQRVVADTISARSPNLQLPSLFVLAPPSASLPPGLHMPVFPSKNLNLLWVNNVPLTNAGTEAINGLVYKSAAVLLPPSAVLWARIATDPNMTYFKAAVQRADQATPSPGLVAGLSNPAANLTVFAPTDAAMQQFLIGSIAQALIAKGLPAATAQGAATALVTNYGTTIISDPASIPDAPIFPTGTGIGSQLASTLTPTTIAGFVTYHLQGVRRFSVNFPAAPTAVQTLLNSAIPAHPGVTIQATFGSSGIVTAATVKGVANATASNIQINPTPNTGTSDQHYINGVLHVIDQGLRPQ